MYTNHKIVVIGKVKKENFYCKLCNFPLVTKQDFDANKGYDCCHECYLQFAQSRRNEWKSGWRPNKTDVRSYISIRRKLYNNKSKEK